MESPGQAPRMPPIPSIPRHSLRRVARAVLALGVSLACAGALAQAGAASPGTEHTERLTVGHSPGGTAGVVIDDDPASGTWHVGRLGAGLTIATEQLHAGDRIVTANGCRVRSRAELDAVLAAIAPGATLELGVRDAHPSPAAGDAGLRRIRLRLPLPPGGAPPPADPWRGLSLAAADGGLRVVQAPAGLAGLLRPGDVIQSIDARPVGDVDSARVLLEGSRGPATVLSVLRDGRTVRVKIARLSAGWPPGAALPAAPCEP